MEDRMTGLTGKKALYWDRSHAHEILFILLILSFLCGLCDSARDVDFCIHARPGPNPDPYDVWE
jgi:hypothetical protein